MHTDLLQTEEASYNQCRSYNLVLVDLTDLCIRRPSWTLCSLPVRRAWHAHLLHDLDRM
jgi:hypothetical protein